MKPNIPHQTLSPAAAAAIAHAIYLEGGDTQDPTDRGGHTRFGISQKAYPDLDMLSLTREMAEQLYYRDYWITLRCDAFHPAISFVLFDIGVNQGVSFAAHALQKLVGAKTDGNIGPKTLALAGMLNPLTTIQYLSDQRVMRYANIVKNDAFQNKFIVGWIKRAITVRVAASKLSGEL
jgi:lysozyme family protein